MKTGPYKPVYQSGTVLILSLVLALLLGSTLASYLYWVRTQNLLVFESQAWNAALAIAEGGVEEGMAQINVSVGTPNPLNYSNSIPNNFQWTGSAWFRTNAQSGYGVTVSNDSPPTIWASGTTTLPLLGNLITRTVIVKTMTNSLFGIGLAALSSINNRGNDITVDAYDSADTLHFTNGLYNSTFAFAGGDVALTSGNMGLGNSDIHGHVYLGPSASFTLGPNGLVGDMPANWPTQNGIQSPDWIFHDYNKEFPDVVAPYNSGPAPTVGVTNTYYLSTGSYYSTSKLILRNNEDLYVAGVVNLYVTGGVDANNGSKITIGPGATLRLYVGADTGPAVGCKFYEVNNNGNAANLQVFGLPTMTSFTLSGNDFYMGTLYAPKANFTLSGGGNNTLDYQGACIVNSVTMNGHFNFHYDINLRRSGPPKGYTLANWQEL